MRKIKVGIIGFGSSGRYFHAGLLKDHQGFEITTISTSRAGEVHEFLPTAEVVQNPEELIANKDIELVINCAPNSLHFPLTEKALKVGKHVVVEKPFVSTTDEGEKLIEQSIRSQKMLTVFQNRRWDGDFLTVQRLIKENHLGKIKQFESHFSRFRPTPGPKKWKEEQNKGSGLTYDLGSHLIDQALTLFGEPNDVIIDRATQKDAGKTDDYFHIIMKYNEMRVILHGSSFDEISPRFQIFGDQKSFTKYGLDPQEEQLKAGLSPLDDTYGREAPENFGELYDPKSKTSNYIETARGRYQDFYRGVYEAIAHNYKPPVEPEDSLKVIKLLEQL